MAIDKHTDLVIDHLFDPRTNRHYLNKALTVLHCHHYASLYTQLADDISMLDGKKLLAEVAEDTFHDILVTYYEEHNLTHLADRITIAEKYYAAIGLGQMKVCAAGLVSGKVRLLHSHVDEGWIKKWGKRDRPVNFITQGYISGTFSALFRKPLRSYSVSEVQSMVTGSDQSIFNVVVK